MKSFFESGEAFNGWLARRRWRIFAACVPALLALLAVATVMGIVLSRRAGELQRRYDLVTKVALSRGNYEIARVASLRGMEVAGNQRDKAKWIFYLAVAMNGQHHTRESQALVSAAAPLDPLGSGCLEAQLLVAQNILSSTNIRTLTPLEVKRDYANPTNETGIALRGAERHLLSALIIDPGSAEADELLGRFYIHTREAAKAREHLMKIYVAKPEVALLLAINADMDDDSAGALQWAERALTAFQHNLLQSAPQYKPEDRQGLVQALMIQQKYAGRPRGPGTVVITNAVPQDTPPIWLGIVRMLLLNGKYGPALATLENLQQQLPAGETNSPYRTAIADVCGMLAQSVPPNAPGASFTRLHFIQQGLTNAPDSLALQLMLAQATHAKDASAPLAQSLLDTCLTNATGALAAGWQFVLWTDCRIYGDLVAARQHLEAAHAMAPLNPLVNNDLAMLDLSSTNAADWEKGLKIIQSVVDQNPLQPEFRGTRGLILARLGRNREAADDLEFSLNRRPNAADERQALATVDAALGIARQGTPLDSLGDVREMINAGNYPQALRTLDQKIAANPEPAYSAAVAEVCGDWVDSLSASRHTERLKLIERGLSQDPKNSKLQALLLAAARSKDESGKAAQKFLDKMVAEAEGDSAVNWYLAMGSDALQQGDPASARKALEAARRLAPDRAEVQIALATVLAGGNHDDLEEGLQLINFVLDKFPGNAQFRGLRGRILAGLGQNEDAVNDLSFAADRLENAADSAAARKILVVVYDKMGKSKLADQQRRLLEER